MFVSLLPFFGIWWSLTCRQAVAGPIIIVLLHFFCFCDAKIIIEIEDRWIAQLSHAVTIWLISTQNKHRCHIRWERGHQSHHVWRNSALPWAHVCIGTDTSDFRKLPPTSYLDKPTSNIYMLSLIGLFRLIFVIHLVETQLLIPCAFLFDGKVTLCTLMGYKSQKQNTDTSRDGHKYSLNTCQCTQRL